MSDTLLDAPPPSLRSDAPLAPPEASQGWLKLSPINRRRLNNFKANKRGWWSLWIFLILFVLSLFAEFIANDRPLIVRYKGEWLFPVRGELSGGEVRRLPRHDRLSRPGDREGDRRQRLRDLAADPLLLPHA